jgi:hypothetical protein
MKPTYREAYCQPCPGGFFLVSALRACNMLQTYWVQEEADGDELVHPLHDVTFWCHNSYM